MVFVGIKVALQNHEIKINADAEAALPLVIQTCASAMLKQDIQHDLHIGVRLWLPLYPSLTAQFQGIGGYQGALSNFKPSFLPSASPVFNFAWGFESTPTIDACTLCVGHWINRQLSFMASTDLRGATELHLRSWSVGVTLSPAGGFWLVAAFNDQKQLGLGLRYNVPGLNAAVAGSLVLETGRPAYDQNKATLGIEFPT